MKFKKIVILDKVDFFNDQKEQLKKLSDELIIYDDTSKTKEEIIKRVEDADCVITSWTDLDRDDISAWPNVKYIGVYATGYSWIDVKVAKEKQITVTNVPAYATESVAEMVFCQLLTLVRKSRQADNFIRETGKFERDKFQGEELNGKTFGIIGLGHIGLRVAEIANAFGMNVIYYSRTKKDVSYQFFENLDDMISKCDVISIHSSSGDEFLTTERLTKLPNNSIVINFGVAGSVNEDSLIKEIQSGRLRAIIDHFANHKIRKELREFNDNTVLSPEIGYYTKQSLVRLSQITIDNIKKFLEGNPQNVVN
jgi:lactate dehydrogenase-like 2-hydroxyacid dehydrogenase